MMDREAARKRVQRAAYDAYQRLQRRLNRLPRTHSEHPALHAQARLAEAYWRDLVDRPAVAAPSPEPSITVYRETLRAWAEAVIE